MKAKKRSGHAKFGTSINYDPKTPPQTFQLTHMLQVTPTFRAAHPYCIKCTIIHTKIFKLNIGINDEAIVGLSYNHMLAGQEACGFY